MQGKEKKNLLKFIKDEYLSGKVLSLSNSEFEEVANADTYAD